MSNIGSVLARVAVLTGGVITGAIVAEWIDKVLLKQAQERSDYDRFRYEQGLTPITSVPPMPVQPLDEEQSDL